MTIKFALKAGCAALAFAAGGMTYAAPIYLDVGASYGNAGTEACASGNCTGIKNQLTFSYDSKTVISESNGIAGINAGDTLTTTAGVLYNGSGVGLLEDNQITNFLPAASSASGNNGYGFPNWILSLQASNLVGYVSGIANNTVPQFVYTSGLIELFLTLDNGATYINFMDIVITSGGSSGGGTVFNGYVDFTNVDSSYNNLFHTTVAACNGLTGFYDIWSTCGTTTPISFISSLDTDVTLTSFSYDAATNSYIAAANHDGSARFEIPEPGSMALFGLALAGLGLTQRRRKQV